MNIHDDAMQRLGRPNVPDLQAQIDAMVDRSAKEADEIRSWRRACESYEQNVRDQRKLLAEAEATIATLREQLAGFAPYLKEGETPLERLTRERADNDALLTLLARAKGDVEAAQAKNATLRAALATAQAERDAALAERDHARAALQAVEWTSLDPLAIETPQRPWCLSYEEEGHTTDCQRQAALGRGEEE